MTNEILSAAGSALLTVAGVAVMWFLFGRGEMLVH